MFPQKQSPWSSGARSMSMEYDEGLRAYMLKIFTLMASALLLTGVVSYGVAAAGAPLLQALFGTPLRYVVMLAPLGVVLFLSARVFSLSPGAAKAWFWTYAGLVGVSLAPIFLVYTGASIASSFFVSASSFAALAIYGYSTKKDLSGLGSFLIMGVFGLLIAGLVNLFLQSTALSFAASALGVLIFAGLTAYDMQSLKNSYYLMGGNQQVAERHAVMGALQLYIDFIGIFTNLLSLMGERK